MLIGKEKIASRHGPAALFALLLSLFLHGQVSSFPGSGSNAPSFQRAAAGKTAVVQRAETTAEQAAKPSKPPAVLASALGVRSAASTYPVGARQSAATGSTEFPPAAHYDARAPPAA